MFDARAGSIIANRYRLVRKLGQGGMGSVWQAEDHALRIDVALKLVDPFESSEILARFEREAHAAAMLRSTHIVHINDYGVDQGSGIPYIAMDLLEGENLAAILRRQKKLSFEDTRRVLLPVAQALRLAHEKKVAHRDLKPENVFIAREGDLEVVKVLDFGIAKRLGSRAVRATLETQVGQILGTPHYMSPEQAQAKSDIDHRTDIWSFGVIAYECITGQRPFDEQSAAAVIAKICGASTPVPSQVASVPAGFDAWFARAVARDRNERFSSIDEAAALLAAIAPQGAPQLRPVARPAQHKEASPANAQPGTDASPVVSSISPAGPRRAHREGSEWFLPATLLFALVIVGAVYAVFAAPGASLAAVPSENEVPSGSALLPAPTRNEVASLLTQAAPVAAPPTVPSAAEASVSQAATVPATPADTRAASPPAPVSAKKKRPAVTSAAAVPSARARTEAAPTSLDDRLTGSPPEEYDPGI